MKRFDLTTLEGNEARINHGDSERVRLKEEGMTAQKGDWLIRSEEKEPIGEAFDTESHIIVAVAHGHNLDESHNCDEMGCGSYHVLYRFVKPSKEQP